MGANSGKSEMILHQSPAEHPNQNVGPIQKYILHVISQYL
jgi:hypothetical protein